MASKKVDNPELEQLSPNGEMSKENETCDNRSKKEEKASPRRRIILEPALICAMMAMNIAMTSLQNFYLRTACTVDLGYSMDICAKGVGEDFRVAEAESQRVVASVNVSRSFVGALISTIVLLFVGPWSDLSGRRKPLLIMCLTGMSVTTAGVLLLLIFPGASTVQVLYVVQLPISAGGSFGLMLAASFSYIGDVCHATGLDVTRTMGTHRAAIQVAHTLGSVSGPLLYRYLGFYGVFSITLSLQLTALLYVIFSVKDINVNAENKVSVLNWRLPFNAVHCVVRPREGRKRIIIIVLLGVALMDRIYLGADILISYMYYRYKFNWTDVLFGSFLAYRNIISFTGTILILTVLKRRLNLSDEIVGVVSCLSNALASSCLIAATNTYMVFLIPLVGIFAQGSQVVQRPLLNKQILTTEQGKIYGVVGALESSAQIISSPLYSLLYSRTVTTMSDAWLIPGIILAIIQTTAYFSTRRWRLQSPAEEKPSDEKNVELKSISDLEFNVKQEI